MDPRDVIAEALKEDTRTTPQYLEFESPALNEKEWLRYAGVPFYDQDSVRATPEMTALMNQARQLLAGQCAYRVSFLVAPITRDEEGYPILPFAQHSEKLRANLEGCDKVVLFAATIGTGIDRLIQRYERVKPQLALMLQGLGAERVESLCDAFNQAVSQAASLRSGEVSELEAPSMTHRRFSPGYGDLPISVQKEFLACLDAERRLGITLNDSFLMSPSKSVTAIIGICG